MPLIDEAKDKASAFQEQGPTQDNQAGANRFLGAATESLKKQGKQESAFGVDQGSPSDFGVNTTKATDADAPGPANFPGPVGINNQNSSFDVNKGSPSDFAMVEVIRR